MLNRPATAGSLIEQEIDASNKPVTDGESTEISVNKRVTERTNREINISILESRFSPVRLAW